MLDTTGSMGGPIEGARRKIWSIATAIVDSNPDAKIRMGLVAYRDIVRRIVFLVGDAPPHMDCAQDTKYPVTLSVAIKR